MNDFREQYKDDQYHEEMRLVEQAEKLMRTENLADEERLETLERRVRMYTVAVAKGMVRRKAEHRYLRRRISGLESRIDSMDELLDHAHDRIDESVDADEEQPLGEVKYPEYEVEGIPVALIASKDVLKGPVTVDEFYDVGGYWHEAWFVLAGDAKDALAFRDEAVLYAKGEARAARDRVEDLEKALKLVKQNLEYHEASTLPSRQRELLHSSLRIIQRRLDEAGDDGDEA